MATKLLGALALFVLCGGVAFGGGYLFFYRGGYSPPPAPELALPAPGSPAAAARPVAAPLPGAGASAGLLVVDALHQNSFAESEIVTLRSRVADRGYDVEFVGDFTAVPKEEDKLLRLEAKLRRADSFLVILPREGYTEDEVAVVARFVGQGGKLLLVADPSRPQEINTLAERFGLHFQPGYLYNQVEQDRNFQNILVSEFQPETLTAGLDTIVLYTAGSIRSSGLGLAFADGNTQSSVVAPGASLIPIARGNRRNVLSVADLTFMIPPHNSAGDNDRLVTNLAEYLTDGGREFDLGDFPHFYDRGPDSGVDILLGQPALLDSGAQLKSGLSEFGISASIRGREDVSRNTAFLGLHEDARQVSQYLAAHGVRVDDALGTPYGPDLELAGTTLTALYRGQDRHVLIVLADTPDALRDGVSRLLKGEFRDDLVSDFTAVNRPTEGKSQSGKTGLAKESTLDDE